MVNVDLYSASSQKSIIIIRTDGRETTRWSHARPMAERQIVMLGCHSYLPAGRTLRQRSRREAGAAAELAASRKEEKYRDIDGRYIFEPIAVETLGIHTTSQPVSS